MYKPILVATALFTTSAIASAQGVLLTGHVQRVILQPLGAEHCPPACPANGTTHPDGSTTFCISNEGGCQTMEVKVDHVYLGTVQGGTREFKSRIGEWGPSFPVTQTQIIVSEDGGNVFWSAVTQRDGKIFFDPQRLRIIGGIPTAAKGDTALVSLDAALARVGSTR